MAQNTNVKITQIYYNGGIDENASFLNDFVELYNNSDQDVQLNGEYALAVAPNGWQKILTGTIPARRHYLVQYASWFSGGAPLPDPDFQGPSQDLDGTKWVLFYYQAGGNFDNPILIDDVDFRSSAASRAPTTDSSVLAIMRKKSGTLWQDTGVHASDFELATPFPRNSAFIAKTTPTLNWGTLTNIVYPATLSTNQLSATSSAPGAFVYTLTSGTNISTNTILNAGTNKLVASFTPIDTNAYNTPAPITNTLVVNKGAPIITWISPVAITYGTALSGTQNNATSTVAGSYAYHPTNGSVLSAGTSSLVVTFTPSDTNNYNSPMLKTNTLTINKANQAIIFGPLADKVVGDANFNLSASAGSALVVTFASSDSNVATISGITVTVVGEGTTTITASQAGNSNWNAAASVPQALAVKSRFAAWSGTETMTTQSVALYAIGGASNSTAAAVRPTSAVSVSNLTLSAIVRTNDPKLAVVGEVSTNLTTWVTNTVTSSNSADTSGVPLNHARKVFSVPQSTNDRKFLRLKATLTP